MVRVRRHGRYVLIASRHQPSGHLARLRRKQPRIFINPWTEPTFADSTSGDSIDGEDLIVRRAAVQALGPYNGSVVAVDPNSGRILALVNQKLAYKSGFQPCSTIKLVAAFAGLSESIVSDDDNTIRIGRRTSLDLKDALAHSNNLYFARIGQRLGFDRVNRYGRLFGLGEKAGFNIPEEQPGMLPAEEPELGMGMMTSFGSGITETPLQLAAIMSAFANEGTLYYLQHPKTQEDAVKFKPQVKRHLNITPYLSAMKPGMLGAVEYGTARRALFDPEQPIYGKTGTCSDERAPGVHLGWFGSFNEVGKNKLVVVVLLTGGGAVKGPVAAGVAGAVYRNLSEQGYFGEPRGISPLAVLSTSCCR